MSTKALVLSFLENNRGRYISGAELAEQLGVSRNSVWKAVNSLKAEGYNIGSVTNKGYCLEDDNDIISSQSIHKYISENSGKYKIEVYKSLDSTNNKAKELATNGAPEGTVVIADCQTAGKGRLGRSFSSPGGTGLYMSIVLRPKIDASKSLYITTAAAAATARAIESLSGKIAQIKWVNDIFIGGKKVCGILTEGAFDFESGGLDYAVLGIGINVSAPDGGFDESIKNIAAAVFDKSSSDMRSRLAAEVLTNFAAYYAHLCEKPFLDEYKRRMFLIGRTVNVVSAGNIRRAEVIGLSDEFELEVRYGDGECAMLSTGEVSIKL